jgi:hypothetical protein
LRMMMSPFLIMAFLVKNMAFALVKKPAIFDGLSLGRKTPRESRRSQA